MSATSTAAVSGGNTTYKIDYEVKALELTFYLVDTATLDLTTLPGKSRRYRKSSAPTSRGIFTATQTRDRPLGPPPKARNSLWDGLPMKPVFSPRATTCPSLPFTFTNFQLPPFTSTNSLLPLSYRGSSRAPATKFFKHKVMYVTRV